MKIQLYYGTAVAAVPASALEVMDRATKHDLKVLLTLAADPALLSGGSLGECVGTIAARVGGTPGDIEMSLSFWRGAGVLTLPEEETVPHTTYMAAAPVSSPSPAEITVTPAPAEATQGDGAGKQEMAIARKPKPTSELPRYTSAELASLLESRQETAAYLMECQNIWGKMFNTHESNIILALVDYLGLDWDYVLALLSYAAKYYRERENQGKSLAYVENMAFTFHKEGIVTPEALQLRFKEMEKMASMEYKLRQLFGLGERALTPTQKKHFSTWVYDYNYDMDMIRMAYNRAVDRTGSDKISLIMNYINKTLEAWNSENLRTPEQIEAADAAFHAQKEVSKGQAQKTGSFNTDDFFAAAVRRSLGDDFDPDKKDA